MKLSMYMLAWYLRDYRPAASIAGDGLQIRGMRFLTDDPIEMDQEYAYFGAARSFFSDIHYQNSYIIVNRRNYLLFSDADYEELLNSILSSFDFFNDWESRLLEATARKGALQELLLIAAEVLENPCVVSDLEGHEIFACSESRQPVDDPYWTSIYKMKRFHPAIYSEPYYTVNGELIHELSASPMLVRNVYPQGFPVLMMYLYQEEDPVVCVSLLQADPSLTDMNLQLTPVVGRFFSQSEEFISGQVALQSGEGIFRELLSGADADLKKDDARLELLRKRLPERGWYLLLIRHVLREDQIQLRAVRRILQADPRFVVPVEYENSVFAVIPDKTASDIEKLLPKLLRMDQFCVCQSMISYGMEMIPDAYSQTQFTLQEAGGKQGYYRCEDFSFAYLLETFRAQPHIAQLLHPALKTLRQYDQTQGGDLRETLSCYLECECNLLHAAEKLHVHRNTLQYRLKRIRELTGVDFGDQTELQYLRLSDWLEE